MSAVDTEAFLRDLYELRAIGTFKSGVHRPTYSREDMEARRWLMAKLTECGLEASIDGIGNVYGRHPGPGPHLLVGSHIESQNEAGWLDGALGVVAGIALARAGLPVDVCAFADEEGHFSLSLPGSRSMIGDLSEEAIDGARNRTDGTPLREALRITPRDRVLVETDAPYLAPKRWRGKRNEPSYVVNTAEVLAEVKGVAYAEMAEITTDNAFRCFSKMPRLG